MVLYSQPLYTRATWYENVYSIVAIIIFSGAIIQNVRTAGEGYDITAADSDIISQLIWLFLYVTTAFLLLLNWRSVRSMKVDKWLLLLVGFAIFSVFWSGEKFITLRRSIALIGTTLFSLFLAVKYTPEELLRLLARVYLIVTVLSYVFVFVFPDYGIMSVPHKGAWQGVFVHKNFLGRFMVVGCLVYYILSHTQKKDKFLMWLGLLLCLGLVLFSQSRGAWVMLLSLMIFLPACNILRFRSTFLIFFIFISVIVVASVSMVFIDYFSIAENALVAMGKDTTLTGRTILWASAIDMIQQRPWLGYGFSAFWLGWDGPSAKIWRLNPWGPPHSHNGILDLWLDLGLVGVGLFLLGFTIAYARSVYFMRITTSKVGVFPIMIITFMFLANLLESQVLKQNNIFWILYTTVLIMLVNNKKKIRRGNYYGQTNQKIL